LNSFQPIEVIPGNRKRADLYEMQNKRTFVFLKWMRRIIACSLLSLLILAFFFPYSLIDFWEILAKLQFGQIVAALFSAGALYALILFVIYVVLTFLFGRFFCSFLCPLGAFMDLVNVLRQKARPKKYSYKPFSYFQLLIPSIVIVLFWIGVTIPFAHLEPYSVMTSVSLVHAGPSLILMAAVVSSYFYGRGFCNFFCPTGFILKLFALMSVRRLKLTSKCVSCGRCEKVCPARCVNFKEKSLDFSRCVLCLECVSVCPNGSLRYEKETLVEKPSPVRRSFLRKTALGTLAGGAFLTPDVLRIKSVWPPSPTPILPPGALSLAHLNAHCTLCHTCVKVCPNHALVPSRYGGPGLLDKPILDPYVGFCQYDCVECTRVCPTGALANLTVDQKHVYRIGRVHFHRNECIVVSKGTSCGACAELCPTGAVVMGPGPLGRDEPVFFKHLCIGCGACQTACPVRPVSPIWVVGLRFHDMMASPPPIVHREDEVMEEEFPF
jgi:polyferredoxin